MWKLLHYLFKWDYLYWENTASRGIARIHLNKENRAYFYQYKCIDKLIFLDNLHKHRTVSIEFLTCNPAKYLRS